MKNIFCNETAKMMGVKSKESCISGVEVLTDLLKSVCKLSGLAMKKLKSQNDREKSHGLTKNVKKKKHELILLGKRASRENKESEFRKKLCLKRKTFKKLITKKKLEHQLNTLQKITSVRKQS